MAIEKNNIKGSFSRLDSEFSIGSRSGGSMSSDDDDELPRSDSEDEDEYDEADSGAGSDDYDLLEYGEIRSEFCQVGDQTCSIPYELYDLPDLQGILSLDVWNDCLTEEEKFNLTKYLPDMDQETFMQTLKELFDGDNFHFISPVTQLFQMLKGGLCEPRVALYLQGLRFFQKHEHYHLLRKHHDSVTGRLLEIREVWNNCKGYSIEEKLRVVNIMRSEKSLLGERNQDMGRSTSSEGEESGEALWSKRSKLRSAGNIGGLDHLHGLDVLSQGRAAAVDPATYGKHNRRRLSKLVHSRDPGYRSIKSGAYGSDLALSRGDKSAAIYDHMVPQHMREHTGSGNDEQEFIYGIASQRDRHVHGNSGKKREIFRGDEYDDDSYLSHPFSARNDFRGRGRDLNINQLSDIKVLTTKPSKMRALYDPAYEDQMMPTNGQASQMMLKEPYWTKKTKGEAFFAHPSFDYTERDVSRRKMKMGRELPDSRLKSSQASQYHMDDRICHPEKRAKVSQENITGTSVRNGGSSTTPLRRARMFHGGEETESDSSDQPEEEEDNSPLILTKLALHGRLENSRSSLSRPVVDWKKGKQAKKDVRERSLIIDGALSPSSSIGDFGRYVQMPELEAYSSSKSRQKPKMQHLQNFTSRFPDDGYYDSLENSNGESNRKSTHQLRRNGQLQAELAGSFPMSMNKTASIAERRQKGNICHGLSSRQSKYLQDYSKEEDGGFIEVGPMGESTQNLDTTLTGCTSSVKKQKGKEGSTEIDGREGPISSKKGVKKRLETDSGSPGRGGDLSELPVVEVGMADLELELKPQKKSFTLITPTLHTGFSFSIIHLLSAVRTALITPNPEDCLEVGKHHENTGVKTEDCNAKHEHTNGSLEWLDVYNPGRLEQTNVPSLTVQEIVNRVRSNPGDPCILETQERLQDLVRGVLKTFSSKTAPLGAKGWKPLVCYEKSMKCWSWTGPTLQISTDETLEESTSPDAWKIPHKMLVKLVDSFASWLKSGQETLQQIGSLPAPPLELMQLNFDEKERFKDLRAQKSLTTISPSSEEVRAYFHKEEQLRYSIPDRAFFYTAADGKKSVVAPLRRCGGKPTSKARDHFMLKRDRPPHVTILCLVRDAASRLPGSIGTRADVCTLIRDSQYIVEDVSDAQVNQVVSGALDRLHYERDPCVQFDGERKLWVYLHREREEEDFEDDGTSSTKKWKRPKKDVTEHEEQVTIASVTGEPSGFGLRSDLNVEPSCINDDKIFEVMYDGSRQRTEDNAEASDVPQQGALQQLVESKMHCLENSANECFYDDT